ncbi:MULTISPECIES: hypothetical protein [Paraburkholderia]|uniref:hypothetical protein n=1 Tax=Paraburkholderia TaxID=1822464 RepID=UPI0022544165|nr:MULTISPECIES: hypothetical protein [Paraburkholderia]MCX4174426.1 hypothetical protein [Paraburkholderia madseniana]MDQ6462429.1 hypothetical protein [Paraburkholderia madseniana]
MKGLQGYSESMLMLCILAIVVTVTLVSFVRSVMFIFSSGDGRTMRTRQIALLTAERLAIVVALAYTGNYLLDVRQRSHAATWHNVPSDTDARYTASYSYLWNNKILLRLYDAKSKKLLAERTHFNLDAPNLAWTDHSLIYDTSADGDDGEISLPPSLLDTLLAKLP